MPRTVRQVFSVNGVPTDVDSAVLSDPTGVFGVKRNDTSAVVVADGTAMVRVAVGTYEYEFSDVPGVAYTAYVEFQYGASTYYIESDFEASGVTGSSLSFTYGSLKARVGHYLFGVRDSFSVDQLSDIDDCIADGLRRVYAEHNWSFFRPVVDVTTTAPYATGTVTVSNGVVTLTGGTFPTWAADGVLYVKNKHYAVVSRTSGATLTIGDTTLSIASGSSYQLGRPEIPMPDEFESISGDSELNYYPDDNACYPPVAQRHDQLIRKLEQDGREFDRPIYYSIRTVKFDPVIGSRKVLAFYPTPDKAYTMRVPMLLRPVMLNNTNQQPIGGEVLAQVIIEACLASAEHNFEEREHIHEKRYLEMIALAIKNDLEQTCPTSLGRDAPKGEYSKYGGLGYDYLTREQRIGRITLNGEWL